MIKDLMTQMMNAISEVMETMFFLPLEPVEGENVNDLLKADDLVLCGIGFKGTFSGSMYLLLRRPTLLEMTENFMGEDQDVLTQEHLEGTLKETLNMIAGNTFSKLDSHSSFALSLPEILEISEWEPPESSLMIETPIGLMAAFAIQSS